MFSVTSLANLLATPVQAWVIILAVATVAAVSYVVLRVTVVRRLDSHSRSLGHMDRWADDVESRMDDLARGLNPWSALARDQRRLNPECASGLTARAMDSGNLSNEQVKTLISRLLGTRAA